MRLALLTTALLTLTAAAQAQETNPGELLREEDRTLGPVTVRTQVYYNTGWFAPTPTAPQIRFNRGGGFTPQGAPAGQEDPLAPTEGEQLPEQRSGQQATSYDALTTNTNCVRGLCPCDCEDCICNDPREVGDGFAPQDPANMPLTHTRPISPMDRPFDPFDELNAGVVPEPLGDPTDPMDPAYWLEAAEKRGKRMTVAHAKALAGKYQVAARERATAVAKAKARAQQYRYASQIGAARFAARQR